MSRMQTNETTELAKQRNRLAVERTVASWIQHCIELIGFGVGFYAIFSRLDLALIEDANPIFIDVIVPLLGLTIVGSGILFLSIIIIVYRSKTKSWQQEDYFYRPPSLLISAILIGTVVFYTLIALTIVIFILP